MLHVWNITNIYPKNNPNVNKYSMEQMIFLPSKLKNRCWTAKFVAESLRACNVQHSCLLMPTSTYPQSHLPCQKDGTSGEEQSNWWRPWEEKSQYKSGWWCNNHLETYEFVNGKDDIPCMKWKILWPCSQAPTRNWYPLVAKDFLACFHSCKRASSSPTTMRPTSPVWLMRAGLPMGSSLLNLRQIDSVPFKTYIHTYYIILLCCMIMYDLPIHPSIHKWNPILSLHQSPGNHTRKHRSSRPAKARWAGAPGSSSPGRQGLGRIL